MGQCMSRKAAGALAASAAVSHKRPGKMQKHQPLQSPDDDSKIRLKSVDPSQLTNRRPTATTKGVAMSFGFKRRAAPSVASNANAARRLANCDVGVDGNGNDAMESTEDTDSLTGNIVPTGRSTPRLPAPKKEATGARVSRFGFRQTQTSRQNKVADLNAPIEIANQNGNTILKRPLNRTVITPTDNNNRNRMVKVGAQPQIGRFTLQSTQLPRPEPVRVIATKSAKTLANTHKRVAGMFQQYSEETSSKDGSLTEDSGVGSHLGGFVGENDIQNLEQLESSPNFGAKRRNSQHKPRNLEVIVMNSKTFDVRDVDDSNDSCDSIAPPLLPQLPSAFDTSTDSNKKKSSYQSGLVKERTLEYQRHLEWDNGGRKVSVTSSDGFSDDYGEEEKTCRDKFRSEKTFIKAPSHQSFLKSRPAELKVDSSPPSSDEQEWAHGGEAMAEEISFSLSSSDESKDKIQEESVPISAAVIGTALQSLINSSLSKAFTPSTTTDLKNVVLTIEDPKFAAVASNTGSLLDDETLLSPSGSMISCSESEGLKKKLQRSSSNSKDINEKPSPPSPGTPTIASNSLSLSDGKDDFLIDDEIEDQPALVFEDNVKGQIDNYSLSDNTIVDSTPKPKRKMAFEGSPLVIRNRKFLQSRTGSLDTLSPCESIASDDLMMDFDYSQSSGMDDCERQSSGLSSMNDTLVPKMECLDSNKSQRDRSLIFDHSTSFDTLRGPVTRPRLLRSRAGTPNLLPDSPRSLDGRTNRSVSRPSGTSSPVRPIRIGQLASTGYDSDDSIRLDRTNHTAMKQDIMSVKTMLLKLRRVLNETDEDILMRSETHSPFDGQTGFSSLTNGIFNGSSCCPTSDYDGAHPEDSDKIARQELAELRRQVLFLQGQLEDKERTVKQLREQMVKLAVDNYHANSAPASTVSSQVDDGQVLCNAATQTERIRPISAGPSLLNGTSPVDGNAGSLVSVSSGTSPSSVRQSRPTLQLECPSKRTPSRLWRRPGEAPSPPRRHSPVSTASSIPRRADSRTRTPASTTT